MCGAITLWDENKLHVEVPFIHFSCKYKHQCVATSQCVTGAMFLLMQDPIEYSPVLKRYTLCRKFKGTTNIYSMPHQPQPMHYKHLCCSNLIVI